MKKEDFAEVLGDIDENFVKEAETVKRTRKPAWVKWGAAAACLCLVATGLLSTSNWQNDLQNGQGTTEQVYTLPQAEKISVELVEWGGEHFKGIVVDAEDNSIYPVHAELSVVFDYDTEILLDDGTLMVFDPDEPDTEIIGWEAGTVISVEFTNYAEYREENHFYNQLFASHVEAKS